MLFDSTRLLKGDMDGGGGGEDVSNVLREFEHGLESLRALYQQRQSLQQALKQREADLHQRDLTLEARDAALAQRDQQLALRTSELEALTAQFNAKLREFESSRSSIEQREANLSDQLTLLTAQQQELATRTEQMTRDAEAQAALALEHEESVKLANAEIDRIRDDIRAQRASLEARAGELDALARDVAARRSELDAAKAAIDEQARAVAVDREAVERERTRCEQLSRESQAVSARAVALETQVHNLHGRLASLEHQSKADADALAAANARAGEFEAQVASLWKAMEEEQEAATKAADAAKRRLEAARAETEQRIQAEVAKHAEKASAEAQRTAQDLARRHEQATADIERQWKQRLDDALARERESASASVRSADERLEALRAEYDARLTKELEAQQRELAAAAQSGASEALAQARARLDEQWQAKAAQERAGLEESHRAQLQQIAAEAKSRLAQIESRYQQELEARTQQARAEGAASTKSQADDSWQSRLDEALAHERTRLSQRLADAVALASPATQSAGPASDALAALKAAASVGDTDATLTALEHTIRHAFADRADLESRLTETRGYLDEAAEIIKMLESQAERQRHAPRPESPGNVEGVDADFYIQMDTRRRRLKLMHALLRDRTDKVRKASEALRHRFEQCEGVLKQRAELSAARERIVEAEKKVQGASTRARASAVMLCAVATMGIIGGLSWALARQVAPATFVATAELNADGRGRTLQEGELQEWQAYHEKLLTDPRFHQMAAERFNRLAMASLGTPTDVKHLIEERIRWESINPGQMSLHLQGQGSRATERTLNTFSAALASHANAAQTARTDGGVTRVTQEARTGDEPIDNTRTYWALGMMAIGTSIAFFVGVALWKKLAGAKTAFEQDHQIAQILDENRWGVQVDNAMEQKEVRGKKAA
jgi:chromosome segregation ATPase